MKKIGLHHFFMAGMAVFVALLLAMAWCTALDFRPSDIVWAAGITVAVGIIGVGAILAALGKIES